MSGWIQPGNNLVFHSLTILLWPYGEHTLLLEKINQHSHRFRLHHGVDEGSNFGFLLNWANFPRLV